MRYEYHIIMMASLHKSSLSPCFVFLIMIVRHIADNSTGYWKSSLGTEYDGNSIDILL